MITQITDLSHLSNLSA